MDPSSVSGSVAFNAVDIAAVVILAVGVWQGFRRGLSGELARLISLAVVLTAGWQAYEPVGEALAEVTRLDIEQSRLAAFLLVIGAAGLCMALLRLVLRQIMEFTFKKPLEKLGGMAAGFLRSLILIALIVVAAGLTPVPYLQRVFAQESLLGSAIIHHAVPMYRRVAEDHPDLRLPTLDGLDGGDPADDERRPPPEDDADPAIPTEEENSSGD